MKKFLFFLFLFGCIGCADDDYFSYFNYFYINNTKNDFNKIIVYSNRTFAEYTIASDDTLTIAFDESTVTPILISNRADSILFYYSGKVKIVNQHNSLERLDPVPWKVERKSEGKHKEIFNEYYFLEDEYFE